MPIWNKKHETMSRAELENLQVERLRDLVTYAAGHNQFYHDKLENAAVAAGDIHNLADLEKLPFTTKQDLRNHYPFGMFCVPLNDVCRVHASSGTTGKPTVGGYTKNDLELWSEVMARTLSSCEVVPEDVVHNSYGYGLFTGGLGFHMGAEEIGCTVIPVSGGLTKRQIMLMEDFGATVLTCTPSYSLVLAEQAAEMGIDLRKQMKLRVGVFGAEPWSASMRKEIERYLGLEAYDIYGLTEIIGPGVSVECTEHDGLHIFEDHFLAEIIDPDTGEQLDYGQEGELVITTLTKEAMPVIRYRTRDRTILHAEPCACGRTMVRMEKVFGRTDDMLIVRGVNVFPSQIESVLLAVDEVEPHYQLVLDRARHDLDSLEIWVEASEKLFQPVDTRRLDELQAYIANEMQQALGISTNIRLMGPKSITRSQGKAKRVIDKREL